MPWPEGSRGEHDAPLPTGKQSHGERDAPLPMGKQSRGERDAPRTSKPTGQHLYLIFDDWTWGYSIRKLQLLRRSPHQRSLRPLEHRRQPEHKHLPPPCICLEATRRLPSYFAAVGTNIIAAHTRNDFFNAPVPECIMPIFDTSSLGVRFGSGLLYSVAPILITVGEDKVFALDMDTFRTLSMKSLCPPLDWLWCDLPDPPLKSIDLTSFVVSSDGLAIFASTDCATFAFDIVNSEWKQSSNRSLPFTGPANYVHTLDIFVGLSKAPDTYGHLCFCRNLGGDKNLRLSKENLLLKDQVEEHEGATLVYLGGSEPGFCLVECLSITEGQSVNMQLKEPGSVHYRYLYRLTTFSLSFDNNGDLTTGESCVVQCYKVPDKVSDMIYLANPVAFWL